MPSTAATDVRRLFDSLMKLTDLLAAVPPPPPIGEPAAFDAVEAAISGSADLLPKIFRAAFSDPLQRELRSVFMRLTRQEDFTTLEAVAGAVYQHSNNPGRAALDRFLAVISNLYRSFLDDRKRLQADFPLSEALPPLAMFQYRADFGPFTLPIDDIA